jgi:predicted MPP superfamily phosphohydrolase
MPSHGQRKRFSWLHLSDLHFSSNLLSDFEVTWNAMLYDLDLIHKDSGPWDAIFITGDLTLHAVQMEYDIVTEALRELLKTLESLGSNPLVLTVPGNHDVDRRQTAGKAEAKLLRFWSDDSGVRNDFWRDDSPYRAVVERSFENYQRWTREIAFHNPEQIKSGLIPGDFSTTLSTGDLRVGIVGLNSAFIQLTAGDYRERLVLDERQLKSVCDEEPDAWAANHDFNMLLTHHPPSQLSPESQRTLRADIAPPGRFLLHLCGDLYRDAPPVRLQESPSLLVQAPSLLQKTVGYIAGTIQLEQESESLTLRPRRFDSKTEKYGPDPNFNPLVVEEYQQTRFHRTLHGSNRFGDLALGRKDTDRIDRLELNNFRNFERLAIDFDCESSLPGSWTCLVGVNGSGKSSILQALCLTLLGEPHVLELGGDRLERMRRHVDGVSQNSEIRAWLTLGGKRQYVELKILGKDTPPKSTSDRYRRTILKAWKMMQDRLVLAYGATRNLSDYRETRHSNLSPDIRRVMTLFDPLTQIASAEVLMAEHLSAKSTVLRLFGSLLPKVFGEGLGVKSDGGRVLFTFRGEPVDALDLPDGFRSSVAWLIDLCAAWSEKFPSLARKGTLADIKAIILIDEIDLHLHPSLQRTLVPRLREALPNVQWIVSTHSPLVLSGFDRREIIALDRDEPGGVRFLDRQILSFSTDQIYDWLMETPPTSVVMEQKLLAQERDPRATANEDLAELLETSPEVDDTEAKSRIRERRELVTKLKSLTK